MDAEIIWRVGAAVGLGPPTVAKEDGAAVVRMLLRAAPGIDLSDVVSAIAARDDVRTRRDVPAE